MTVLPIRSRSHPAEFGLYVFLVSLGMLFSASLVAYLFARLTGQRLSNTASIQLPAVVWFSTGSLLTTSFALHRSLMAVRREKQARLRGWLLVALAFGLVFLVLQSIGAWELFRLHSIGLADRMTMYGVVMVLITLHAAHVVGGLVVLGWVTLQGFWGRYDHECYRGLWLCVAYWHFLDAVWIVMLATFWLTI